MTGQRVDELLRGLAPGGHGRRGAADGQRLDPPGVGEREPGREHPAPGAADDVQALQAEVVQQGGELGDEEIHRPAGRVGVGQVGAAPAAQLVGDDGPPVARQRRHRERAVVRGTGAAVQDDDGQRPPPSPPPGSPGAGSSPVTRDHVPRPRKGARPSRVEAGTTQGAAAPDMRPPAAPGSRETARPVTLARGTLRRTPVAPPGRRSLPSGHASHRQGRRRPQPGSSRGARRRRRPRPRTVRGRRRRPGLRRLPHRPALPRGRHLRRLPVPARATRPRAWSPPSARASRTSPWATTSSSTGAPSAGTAAPAAAAGPGTASTPTTPPRG